MISFQKRAASATIWTLGSFGASQALRFGGNLFLARLLIPEDFGMMALISIFMLGLVMFSDVGIGPSIIRSNRGEDPNFLNTAWTIQVVRGFSLWACASILALPFADYYGHPSFAILIPIASITVIIAGLESTALHTENRSLNLGRIAVLELVSQISGLILMITWAYFQPSIWALIAGGLATAIVKTILSHFLPTPIRNTIHWNKSAAKELVSFGKWVFLSTAVTFSANQMDRLVLGKLVSLDMLGIYSIAFMWARAPLHLTQIWCGKVFLPVVSQVLRSQDKAVSQILAYRRDFLLFIMAPTAALVVVAPSIIKVLYPPAYEIAGPIISILSFGVWLRSVEGTYRSINLAVGTPQMVAFGNIATIVLFMIFVVPFYDLWGVYGVAIASAGSQIGLYSFCSYGALRVNISSLRGDSVLTLMFASMVGAFYWSNDHAAVTFASYEIGAFVTVSEMLVVLSVILVVILRSRKESI